MNSPDSISIIREVIYNHKEREFLVTLHYFMLTFAIKPNSLFKIMNNNKLHNVYVLLVIASQLRRPVDLVPYKPHICPLSHLAHANNTNPNAGYRCYRKMRQWANIGLYGTRSTDVSVDLQ